MGIARKYIMIFSILAAIFILFPTIKGYASSGCRQTRFTIEDEISGQEIGLIYTDSNITGSKGSNVCLEGVFLEKKYQYQYKCNKAGTYDFVKKFKERINGCKWGVIH